MFNDFTEFVFWIAFLLVINSYFLYPLIIVFLSKLVKKNDKREYSPKISIIIAARNEEKVIENRIKNISELNYNLNNLEVLVGSDNSTDNTNELLISLQKKYDWLKVFIFNTRQGKAGIINKLSQKCNHDIWVFTDANTVFKKNALMILTSGFIDEKVGGVCGRLVLKDETKSIYQGVEEETYWKFETILKNAEGNLGVLIGANGGNFAIRKEWFSQIPIEKAVTDDFFISLQPLLHGKKVIYKINSIAIEDVGKNVSQEFQRKIRFASTNFQTIPFVYKLLSPLNPLISYAFFSHKLSRWFFPVILLALLISNIFILSTTSFYFIFLVFQLLFYGIALIGYFLAHINIRIIPFSVFYYFLIANYALMIGFLKFIFKKHSVFWNPTER